VVRPIACLRTPLLRAAFATVVVSLAGDAGAQDLSTALTTHSRGLETPPILVASPDAAVHDGAISIGTAGKLVLEQKSDVSDQLHTTLNGSVAFQSLGTPMSVEPSIRKGSLRWALSGGTLRTELGLARDPLSQTVHALFESTLPSNVVVDLFGQSRWQRTAWGDERVTFSRCSLRRQLTPHLLLQPTVYQVRVQNRSDIRWIGTTLRVVYRGGELVATHEGVRGWASTARKSWQLGGSRWTLGSEMRHRPRADRAVWEIGWAHGGVGVSLYPGRGQRGVLLAVGPIQLGWGQGPKQRQTVLGFKSMSLSYLQRDGAAGEIGVGFAFGGWLRRVSHSPAGWLWQPPITTSAANDPRLRWPGIASL
jgi:hypothetical protein